MIYGSVCSGLEAATAAWHTLGWKPAWFSEIEKFPSAVLAHHYPKTPNLGDMTRLYDHPGRSPIELLVGGTPCQSFSVAGLRKGMDDARGNLALVFIQLLRRTRARWVLWENVPGVLSSSGGKDLASFFGGLVGREVKIPEEGWGVAGIIEPSGPDDYGIAWRVLDAQYFGVPQRRRRIFVVGYIGDWRPAAAVLLELHSVSGNPPPSRGKREGTPRGIEIGPGGGKSTGLAPTLDARCKDGPRRNQLGIAVTHAVTGHGQYADVPPTVRASGGDCGGGSEALVSTFSLPAIGVAKEDEIASTMTKNQGSAGESQNAAYVVCPPDVAGTLGSNHGNIKAEQAWTGQLVVAKEPITVTQDSTPVVHEDGTVSALKVGTGFECGQPPCVLAFDTTQITHPANHSNPQPGDPCHPLAKGGHPPAIAQLPVLLTMREGKEGGGKGPLISEDKSLALTTGNNQVLITPENETTHTLRGEGFDASEEGSGRGTPLVPMIFDPLNNKADEVATSLGTNCGGSTGRRIAFTQNQAGDILSGDVAPAMGTNQNATGRNTPKAMIGSAVRRLTPRECERLQGFPDDYTLIPYGTKVAADGPRYKALGNSMAVPCMAWLGQRIEMVDALIRGLKK